jgi:hypothetical protein
MVRETKEESHVEETHVEEAHEEGSLSEDGDEEGA